MEAPADPFAPNQVLHLTQWCPWGEGLQDSHSSEGLGAQQKPCYLASKRQKSDSPHPQSRPNWPLGIQTNDMTPVPGALRRENWAAKLMEEVPPPRLPSAHPGQVLLLPLVREGGGAGTAEPHSPRQSPPPTSLYPLGCAAYRCSTMAVPPGIIPATDVVRISRRAHRV